jgi:hypothetical protein
MQCALLKVPLMRPNRLFTTSFIFSGDAVLSNWQAFDLQLAVSPESRTGNYRQRLLWQPVLPVPAEVPRAAGLVDSHQPWNWKCENLHQNIPGKLHQVTVLLVLASGCSIGGRALDYDAQIERLNSVTLSSDRH